jgi:molybdopterin molybdotransferase
MSTPQTASADIARCITSLPIESLPLPQCVGAVLREPVYAERDDPPFDRVCMDGIAIDSAALSDGVRRLTVQGTQGAGVPALHLASGPVAVEVMTGAILPHAADCVIPIEEYTTDGIAVTLPVDIAAKPYRNIEKRGGNKPRGAMMLAGGTVLGAPEIAVAASAGMPRLRVSAQPAFMIISTGNELVEPGEPMASYQIRRSNSYAVGAALRLRGFQRVGDDHLPDDVGILQERLASHLKTHDVVILSGGVSMGKFDHVPQVLRHLGVRQVFHKVAQRPGKPLWFGIGPQGQAVFGLPGNPVSTLVCTIRYVIPAMAAAMGSPPARPERLTLAAAVSIDFPLTYFLPVRIARDDSGLSWAEPNPTNTSGDFLSLTGTDGFVELPPGPITHARGFVADFYRW